jgi:hypothetical protein
VGGEEGRTEGVLTLYAIKEQSVSFVVQERGNSDDKIITNR